MTRFTSQTSFFNSMWTDSKGPTKVQRVGFTRACSFHARPEAWRFRESFLERIFEGKWNAIWTLLWTGCVWDLRPEWPQMVKIDYFEHSSKWTNLVFQLLNSPSVKKSTDIVDKVPTASGFAVIISSVGSYQERVYFINYSWRLSLTSVTCGSFGHEI